MRHAWDDAFPGKGKPYDRHSALLAEMWDSVTLRYDYIRSCNGAGKPVWAAEFQGGPVSTGLHKGRVPSADDMPRWMLTGIASGITAFSFWVTRAEIMAAETNGFSLLDSEGDTTARYEEVARIGRALNRFPELFGQPTLRAASVETRRFVKRLMAANGVVPAHPGELLLRKRTGVPGRGVPGRGVPGRGSGRAAWIVTNPTARDTTENISVAG